MKRIFASLLLMIFMAPVAANALTLDISAAEAAKAIQGEWKLLSFQRHGEQAVRYEDRNIVWRFDGRRLSVMSDDLEVTPNSWTSNYWGLFYVQIQS